MARTIKGDFVDFTDCSNEVYKEFETLEAENEELCGIIEELHTQFINYENYKDRKQNNE